MSRRDHKRDVYFLRGGTQGFDQWTSFPMVGYGDAALAAEEPYWWLLPDNNLVALFRDNRRSGFLYRAFSTDNGRTWSRPTQTDFPDATSKFCGTYLPDGRYVLVSNANPAGRDPLTIAVSDAATGQASWAYVNYNGKRLGETPKDRRFKLPVGKQKLVLDNPKRGKRKTVEVEVFADRVQLYSFEL